MAAEKMNPTPRARRRSSFRMPPGAQHRTVKLLMTMDGWGSLVAKTSPQPHTGSGRVAGAADHGVHVRVRVEGDKLDIGV